MHSILKLFFDTSSEIWSAWECRAQKAGQQRVNCDVHFKMFRYNPKANYQPNGGRYLQILSGKDLYKQTIVMSSKTHGTPEGSRAQRAHDTFPVRFLNIFIDYPLGQMRVGINCGRTGTKLH